MSSTPIVVDLGATSRKRIRELKRGEGRLKEELQEVIEQIRAQLGADAENKELVPIVLVYSRRKKQPRSATDLIV